MTERMWLLREALRRVLSLAPLPPATWPSIARRVAVIIAFFALGITIGDLATTVAACFGALQVGLVEAALPLRRLVRLLLLLGAACIATVTVAMLIGGTWWAVFGIAALAYVFGATASTGANAMTIGVSGLALAVIFAGSPVPPAQVPGVVGWFALGVAVQSALWLITWSPERRWFARRALANKLRADAMMLRSETIVIPSLVRAHAQSDVVAGVLRSAGFPAEQERRLTSAFSASIVATRAIVAWQMLERPGEHDRMAAGVRLEQQAHRLDGWLARRPQAPPPAVAAASPAAAGLVRSLDEIDRSIAALDDGGPIADVVALTGAARIKAPAPANAGGFLAALKPGTGLSRHGLRMAIGVGLAEAVTVIVPLGHSFWLPLTVVFVLRPDWSFTVVRGGNRLAGNLAAVAAVPAMLLILSTSPWAMLVILIGLAAVTFRWFFGNYAIASFGVAGTILLLSYATNPVDDLFAARFVSTFVGALIAILVVLAIPGWSRSVAPAQVESVVAVLTRWRSDIARRSKDHGSVSEAALDADVADARRALIELEPSVTGVLLEPGDKGRPVELAMVFASGARELAALTASTYALVTLDESSGEPPGGEPLTSASRADLSSVASDLDRAVLAYREALSSTRNTRLS